MVKEPVRRFWDIETGFNKIASFSAGKVNWINASLILKERYIICAAYKDKGSKKVHTISVLDDKKRFKKDPCDDYYVVKEIHKMISEADVMIAHFGDAFDMKFFNGRCLYHGIPPLPPVIQEDTYKMAKSKFKLNSLKLDYLGQLLGVGNKIRTEEQLWLDCLFGKVKAVRDMVTYNKQDVVLLEKVYDRLEPFCKTKFNYNHYTTTDCCPRCGSEEFIKKGAVPLIVNTYQGYMCKKCKHRFRSGMADQIDRRRERMR